MGAQNIIRVLTEAGLQGFPLDLGLNGVLKMIPVLNDTHRFQIGNGTLDMDARIYLGAANKYVHLDVNTSSMKFHNTNVTIGGGDVTVNSITANSATITTLNTTGSDITCNTLTVTSTGTIGGTLSLNTFQTAALTVLPAVDDVGAFNIGNATKGMDFKWTIPGGKSVLFDRGAQQVTVVGVPIITDAAMTVNAAITSDNTVTTVDLTVSNNTAVSSKITAESLVIVPPADDTACLTVGNGTTDGDVKIFLGAAGTYFELNRGASQCRLRGVSLNTDSPIVVNAAIITDNTVTAGAVNTSQLNFDGPSIPAGNTWFANKYITLDAGNLTVTSAHYGGYIRVSGATDKTITLPTPVGKDGTWLDILHYSANNTTVQAVNSTSQLLAIVGNITVNTAKMNNWAEAVRITSVGDKWIVSPFDGTTLDVT
jgi:hypothetical protein